MNMSEDEFVAFKNKAKTHKMTLDDIHLIINKDHIISQAVDSGFVILVEKKMPNYTILKSHKDCPYLNILFEDKLLSILSYLNISCNSKTSKDLKKVIDGIKFEDKNLGYDLL